MVNVRQRIEVDETGCDQALSKILSLPLSLRLYKFWSRLFGRDDEGKRLDRNGNAVAAKLCRPQGRSRVDVSAVLQDPEVRTKPSTWIIAFGASIAAGVVLNALGTKSISVNDVIGVVVLGLLTAVAFVLAKYVPAVPSSVWVGPCSRHLGNGSDPSFQRHDRLLHPQP